MGARRSSSRNTHTRANRRRAARSGRTRPPLAWLRAAVLALGLSATAAGAAAASTSDLAGMGVVSFDASRQLMLLDGPGTEPVGLPVARGYPHELDMSGDGGVLLIERSLVERIDPADPTQRWQLQLRLPGHGVLSPEGGRAYVSRATPAVLTAIRVGTVGAPEWTLALPGRARALALDGTGRWLFAAYGYHVGHVAVIDTAVGRVARQWVIGKPVAALRLSRDGGTLYTLNRSAGQVSAIRVADGVTQATVKVGAWPSALALAPDDAQLYVAEPQSKTVAVLSGAELRLAGRIVLPGRPHDVGRTPDGAFVVVTSPSRRAVYWVDTVSRQVVRTQRFRRRPWRVVFAREVLSTPTVTPTPTAGGVEVPTPTPTTAPSWTPTSSPTSMSSATPPTETPLPAATPTDTPTLTATGALTPTHTPAPQGMVVGAVYDDSTAQPLSNVLVSVLGAGQSGTNTTTSTNSDGHYTLPPLPPGDTVVTLSAPGYTRAVRHVNIAEHAGAHAHDARLTPLGSSTEIGADGGTIAADFHSPITGTPANSLTGAPIEMTIPPGALTEGTQVTLTPLSPQGLIAPLPLGWSVLLGTDIQLPSPDSRLPSALLRIPLAALGAADPQTITAAIWDGTAQQWLAGPAATLDVDLSTLDSLLSTLNSSIQLALLVADATPAAPPPPVVGEPMQGVGPVQGSADSGSVTADPLVILAGTNRSAFVLTRARSATPLPSGTLLRVDLREHYTLRDGSDVTGTVATEEIVGYQVSPSTGVPATGSPANLLAAYFRLVPSRNYGLGELRSGLVDIALSLAEAAGNVALIDSNGGTVNGPSGLRLVVPPHAATGGSLLTLVPVAPASLPAGAGTRADFVGAFTLQVSGGGLDPLAAYRLGLGATVADGQQFVVGRWETGDGSFALAALGHSDGGDIVIDACPSGLGGCLAGLDGSGTYAVFALPAAVAIVTGTVADSTGPRAGIPVGSDQLPVVSVTDASGCYVLPAPVGVSSKLTARDTANDLSGSASVLPSPDSQLPSPPLTADIELRPSPPQVVQINPPNHASQVERSAVVTVTFSKAIDPASITDSSVRLAATGDGSRGTGATEIAVRRSLSADGTQLVMTPTDLLIPNTVYRLLLTSAIADRHGNSLSPRPLGEGEGEGAFVSDFTTSPVFKADALPPNTLRVSLPDDGAGNVPPIGTVGRVFVCGGASLAAPGTAVVVQNATSQVTYTASATTANGVSGSDPSTGSGQGLCDFLFPGRCDTAAPGAFCAVVDAAIGDKIQVQVQDALHNTVTLDAGNMTDERTGATAIGPDGGRVAAVEDARYQADVPPGAFDTVHTVTVFPVRNDEFPVQLSDDAGLQRLGAVFLDFGDDTVVAAREIDLTIPAPPDFDPQRQVLVGHVIQFRGWPELTMVDTASYASNANGQGTLTTNSPPFPGVTRAGHYDFCTSDRAVGYAVGMVDKEQSTIAVIPTFITFVFPFVDPVLTKFAMPVPANQPFTVSLTNVNGVTLDAVDIEGPPPGEIVDIGTLSDDPTPPAIDGFDIAFNQRDVPGDVRPVLTFNRPVRSSDGRLPIGSIEVRGPSGLIEGVWVVVSPDGRKVQFFPKQPLPPGVTITVHVVDVRDFRGRTFPGFSTTFTTYDPVLVASLPLPANDVDVLRRVVDGVPQLYAVVARDGDETSDDQHGLTVVDVRNPRAPRVVADVATPGVDRAVRVVTSDPPLVLSVDGAGNPQRFGTLRAFDLSDPVHPVEIGRRVLNLSPQVIHEQIYFLDGVPNEGGVPRSLALLGAGTVYVANPPVLGVQGVTIGGMIPPHNAVEGSFPGGYRAVATIGPYVLAAGQGHGQSELAVLSTDLTRVIDRQPLDSAPLELITAPGYPIDLDGDGNLGAAEDTDGDATTDADERLDLVLVPAGGSAISVFALGAGGSLTPNGSMMLPSEIGGVRGGTVDPQHRRLYLAGGTAGLVIVNFDDPLQSYDPGSVLKTLRLSGQARQVRLLTDARGIQYALVASDSALDIVQLAPAEAGLTIYDTNNSSVVEEQYEESEGTFILANNDNDNVNADSQGRPIIDRDDPGRVEGENDLRRLDIVAPMRDGVLMLDMPTGAEQARVWLSNEREGLLVLPWQYDLGRGEHPPQTVWIEGVAPSAADRDVRITYHWEPPPDSGLDPIDDAVTATVVELDFIPGQHGTNEPTTNWLDDRKTTFLHTDAEDVEALMNGDLQASHLGQGQYGTVRIRGLDPLSPRTVTVRTTEEASATSLSAPVLDETLPGDLILDPVGPREMVSVQDVLVYTGEARTGDGQALSAPEVRAQLRPQGLLPLQSEQQALAGGAVEIALQLRSARPSTPSLVAGGAGVAVLEVIDAQAFASQISAGVRGSALYDEYLAFDAGVHENLTGMEGALADRWSRLIVELVLPATDPHTSFDFHLVTDPPSDQVLLGSNHRGDGQFPFGMLSLTGFEGFNADETAPEQVTADGPTLDMLDVPLRKQNGRRVALVTFTPPGSFPFRSTGAAGLTQGLTLSLGPSDSQEVWAKPSLLLVRPPVVFVHGLTGSPDAWGKGFINTFHDAFVFDFVDYASRSVSGFDAIFTGVPRKIEELLRAFRTAHHSSFSLPQGGERGLHLPEVTRKRIAATQVDAVGHSMGGLALRWFVSDTLSRLPSQPRQITYPSSAGISPNPLVGVGFPPVQTFRVSDYEFLKDSNFRRGSIRKIVTLASPQLGSPYGNYVTHEICGDDRSCYTSVIPPRAGRVAALLGTLFGAIPSGASSAPDAGTAVYDLAQGSNAIELLQNVQSDPVPVHSLAVTENTPGNPQSPRLGAFEGLLMAVSGKPVSLERYCPNLAGDNSDVIVPLASQLYGTGQHTVIPGFWHGAANQSPTVAAEVSDRLLYDRPGNAAVNSFEEAFPSGIPVPLECH